MKKFGGSAEKGDVFYISGLSPPPPMLGHFFFEWHVIISHHQLSSL